jgi:tetratricopeptide (TPR) repeat protein
MGERDAARTYVAKVSAIASQPETAYVLAALDLAESEPFWSTVIDRLRMAAAAETSGRARAALVYALARSGDPLGAKTELAKLDSVARPYSLLPNLRIFVDKAPSKTALDHSSAPIVPHIAVSALPQQASAPQGAANTGSGEGPGGEQSGGMQAASQAIKRGDWTRARRIYEALVTRNPGDSEALAGIGDVARAQGDGAGAITAYKRALAVNPSYLPALLGVADTEWASGDHASAQRSYKDIADRFPEGTYPSYVKTRSELAPHTTAAPPAPSGSKPWDPGNGI